MGEGEVDTSSFWEAVRSGDSGEVNRIMNAGLGADVSVIRDVDGNNALHVASTNGHIGLVNEFLPRFAEGSEGLTALHYAARHGHVVAVQALLQVSNVDVNATNTRGEGSCVIVDAIDKYGKTPLHCAASEGSKDIVNLLLLHNADIHAKDRYERTALRFATMKGHTEIVSALVSSGKLDIHDIIGKEGGSDSMFYYAAYIDNALEEVKVKIIRSLLEALRIAGLPCGENTVGKEEILKDAIFFAAEHGHAQVVGALLGVVNVSEINEDGRNVLHLAAQNGHHEIVKMLLTAHREIFRGIDVNLLDKEDGYSPFHMAIDSGKIACVRTMLDHSKEVNITKETRDGKSSLQLAHAKGRNPAYSRDPAQIKAFEEIEYLLKNTPEGQRFMDILYKDRQVYIDAANAILIGAALIASVTFAAWLQPPLNYTGDSYPQDNYPKYSDVEHNVGLGIFWVFNSLSFYFATGTLVLGVSSVLPQKRLFIKDNVVKLRRDLLCMSSLLVVSVVFVLFAFGVAGIIVLVPRVRFRLYMIIPTCIGGVVCVSCLGYLFRNLWKETQHYFHAFLDCFGKKQSHPSVPSLTVQQNHDNVQS